MVHTCDEAERILAPYKEPLSEIVYSAIEDYQSLDGLARARHTRRSKSSVINDYMIHHAKEKLSHLRGVRFVQVRGGTRVIIENQFQLRLKKLDQRLRSSNVPTQLVMEFLFQVQALLPGTPDRVTNVVAGYQWNDLQTWPKGAYIVCPRGLHNDWVISLPARPIAAKAIPEYLARGDEAPSRRVRFKDETATKSRNQEARNGGE